MIPPRGAARALVVVLGLAVALAGQGCADDGAALDAAARADADAGVGAGDGSAREAGAGGDSGGDAAADAGADSAPPPLRAIAEAPAYGVVGKALTLVGARSTGAVSYRWTFGDGNGWSAPRSDSDATVTYAKPGRYAAVLEVFDANGATHTASVSIAVTHPLTVTRARHSSTIIRLVGAGDERIAVVSPDSNEVMIAARRAGGAAADGGASAGDSGADAGGDGGSGGGVRFAVVARRKTAAEPRTVAQVGDWLAVACQGADRVEMLSLSDASKRFSVALPRAARPYGVVATADGRVLVSLSGTGQLAEIAFDGSGAAPKLTKLHDAIPDARAVAVLPDGRVAVSRWRSPMLPGASGKPRGALVALDLSGARAPATWTLAFDPQAPSDTEIGGVPSYLGQIVVSPTGREAVLPSLQANVGHGSYRSGVALREDTTVRAILSYLALPSGSELTQRRLQFDGRGLAYAAAYSSHGDYLFVTTRGAQVIERVDALTQTQSGTIFGVGYAPEGLVLSGDDRFLYVNAYMSRELVVFDVSSFAVAPQAVVRLRIPSAEPLSPALLRGKQLFNDSADRRITKDRYIACAHCHLEGASDNLVWDFTDRGEGLRNTISLLGRAGAGDGPIHWSGNFDEIHDFEHDIRGPFGGAGLMSNAAFNTGTRNTPLGDKKAGTSADLDALAAYVTSLTTHRPSPHRASDGSLTALAQQGKTLFQSAALGCATCHSGPRLTDSAFVSAGTPRLHDVGTLGPGSGKRLGGALGGIDTPTLHGLWNSAPYLHDGSAATLRDVLTTRNAVDKHGKTSGLTSTQIDALVAYLRSLDGT